MGSPLCTSSAAWRGDSGQGLLFVVLAFPVLDVKCCLVMTTTHSEALETDTEKPPMFRTMTTCYLETGSLGDRLGVGPDFSQTLNKLSY